MTDALIDLVTDKEKINIDEINTALGHVQGLLERLNSSNQDRVQSMRPQPQVATLKEGFLNSVKIAARPGINLD